MKKPVITITDVEVKNTFCTGTLKIHYQSKGKMLDCFGAVTYIFDDPDFYNCSTETAKSMLTGFVLIKLNEVLP